MLRSLQLFSVGSNINVKEKRQHKDNLLVNRKSPKKLSFDLIESETCIKIVISKSDFNRIFNPLMRSDLLGHDKIDITCIIEWQYY